MEPTTIAIIAGASALSAFAGVAAGRLGRGAPAAADDAPSPAPVLNTNRDRERLDELQRAHDTLRAALALPDRGAPVAAGPLSSQLERFELALRELRSRKFTRATAIYDTSGLLLMGRGERDELGVLGAVAGAASSFGLTPDLDALEWSSERGASLHVERVAVDASRDVMLAVWTDGARVTPSALTIARALINGDVRERVIHDARARLRVHEEVPQAILELTSELPLTQLTLGRGEEVDISLGESVDASQVGARAALWRWASTFGQVRARLGALHAVHLFRGDERVSGYAVPRADAQPERTLWLTLPRASPSSDARVGGWLGQLRWQLARTDATPHTPHKTPSKETRRPEEGRGATP